MKQFDEKELYAKILITYPDITELDMHVNIHHDNDYDVWIVRLEHQDQRVYTHLEPEEAQALFEGQACIPLETQIRQLVTDANYRN